MVFLRSISDLLVLTARESSSLAARVRARLGPRLHAGFLAALPDLHTDEPEPLDHPGTGAAAVTELLPARVPLPRRTEPSGHDVPLGRTN